MKSCNSHDGQCREIFWWSAKSASPRCYKNQLRKPFWPLWCKWHSTYSNALFQTAFVGNHCENVGNIPHLGDPPDLQYTHINGVTCWSVDYHLEMSTPDVGEVERWHHVWSRKDLHTQVCQPLFCHSSACPETCNMKDMQQQTSLPLQLWVVPRPTAYLEALEEWRWQVAPASARRVFLPIVVLLVCLFSFTFNCCIYASSKMF